MIDLLFILVMGLPTVAAVWFGAKDVPFTWSIVVGVIAVLFAGFTAGAMYDD